MSYSGYASWYKVWFLREDGSPTIASTTKSLVFLYLASDGLNRNSFGFTTSAFSPYRAPNKILNDSSVPLDW